MNTEHLYRQLDATLNRSAEAFRVLMDLVRFGHDNATLSAELKALRHELIQTVLASVPSPEQLVSSRASDSDVGRPDAEMPCSPAYSDWSALCTANLRRAQEGLRSIEESLRLVDTSQARKVEALRYRTYDLGPQLQVVCEAANQTRLMDFELYVVTDRRLAGGRALEWVVAEAIRGGAGCIQLRDKHETTRESLELARELRHVTREEGATFIINDRLDLALEVGADGVHLGQDDLPLEAARRVAAGALLIGISTHNPAQALAAQAGGAGYINIGPIFQTQTKGVPVTPVGPDLVRQLAPELTVPFTTMGGIHLENVGEVVAAGADRVAVVSEVIASDNPRQAAAEMVAAIQSAKAARRS